MKTAEFFIDKAKQYTSTIDEIVPSLFSKHSLENWNQIPEYKNQKEKVSDIRLKTKLLFSEFDNGEVFKDEINKIDKDISILFNDDELLEKYKHMLSLFIEHVQEFRN